MNREKPWYDNNNSSDFITTTTKKIQQLPHIERKHKKNLRNSTKSTHNKISQSDKEQLNFLEKCEKDIDSSIATAIVQPRKKDKMEIKMAVNNTVANHVLMKNANACNNNNDIHNLSTTKTKITEQIDVLGTYSVLSKL